MDKAKRTKSHRIEAQFVNSYPYCLECGAMLEATGHGNGWKHTGPENAVAREIHPDDAPHCSVCGKDADPEFSGIEALRCEAHAA